MVQAGTPWYYAALISLIGFKEHLADKFMQATTERGRMGWEGAARVGEG